MQNTEIKETKVANKWITALKKMDGALDERKDPFANFIATDSPSVNFIFGRTHGLPLGYSMLLWGPQKGGKSVLSHAMTGWLHNSDPEAIAVKFDTEMRADGQLDEKGMKLFGIDPERLVIVQTNSAKGVFDQIEQNLAANCAAGAPIKLVVIDSVSGIMGRRMANNESIEDVTIGDSAQTMQIGLQRILPVIRKYGISLVLIAQARAEMDQLEIRRGNKYKSSVSWATKHFCEYFVCVEGNENAEGRKDIFGNELVNEKLVDLADKGEKTARKIRVKMKASSMGPEGRVGEFTFDFSKGMINQFEEVFKLGVGRGIIEKPSNVSYTFGGKTWRGKDACLKELAENKALCKEIVDELKRRDLGGEFTAQDQAETVDINEED